MKIVIIEDEQLTADDLSAILMRILPDAKIVAILQSVKESIAYFNNNPVPQLIFSDIQLGDGLSFEIFDSIRIDTPVIFCTAFDEYAIEAFNANGIHYVLKPFNQLKIKNAIEKYLSLQGNFINWNDNLKNTLNHIENQSNKIHKKQEAVLVYYQNKVIPIKLTDIAIFYLKNEIVHILTFQNKIYTINKSLDELQQMNDYLFYRANRQYIVNRKAVKEAEMYQSRKVAIELNIPFTEVITISKEKMTSFFEWLSIGIN